MELVVTVLYNEGIKRLLTAFGSLFNNLSVHREFNGTFRPIKIPIHFAPASYEYIDILQHPNLRELRPSLTLPILTYEIMNYEIDGSRKENRFNTKLSCEANVDGTFNVLRSPTAYSIGINLYLFTEYLDDVYQIHENITTAFNPKITIEINQENGIISQVPIIFNSHRVSDPYEADPTKKTRIIQTTFNFTSLIDFYRDTRETTNVIKSITLDYTLNSNNQIDMTQQIQVDPLTSNIDDDWIIKRIPPI